MAKAEKKNAATPVRTESDSSVKRTLVRDVAPDHGCQNLVGVVAQLQHLDGVFIAAIGFDLKPEQAEAEDREVEAGKQRQLDDAGEDARARRRWC